MPSNTLTIDNLANSLPASSPIVSATSTVFPLPADHPPMHEHSGGTCPVTGKTHAYCPPQKGDIRSVCPALNTMANHGFMCASSSSQLISMYTQGFFAVPVTDVTSPSLSSSAVWKPVMVSLLLSLRFSLLEVSSLLDDPPSAFPSYPTYPYSVFETLTVA